MAPQSAQSEEPALIVAARTDDAATVKGLLDEGADILVSTRPFGWTALHHAAGYGALEATKALLAGRGDVNVRASDAETPLHIAAQEGHEAAVRLLLARGADVAATGDEGETPLHAAVQHVGGKGLGHIAALLEAGSDPHHCDGEAQNAYAHARLFTNRKEELEPLLDLAAELRLAAQAAAATRGSQELAAAAAAVTASPASPPPGTATGAAVAAAREQKRQHGIRPIQPSYYETPLLSVGKRVRVRRPADVDGRAHRADIDYVDEAAGTVDVVYLEKGVGATTGGEAEETVPASAISALESVEVEAAEERQRAFDDNLYAAAAAMKEGANTLFKMKDYEAAIEHYGHAIAGMRRFQPRGLDVESCVLVNQSGTLVVGGARLADSGLASGDERADVLLRQPGGAGGQQLQVLKGVPWRVLIPVHTGQLLLHSSLYMNRARGLAQVGRHQESAQDLSVAIGLWTATGTTLAYRREQLTKAYYLRAKARLVRMRVGPARADVREAWALEPAEATAKLLRQVEREIDAAQKEQARSNRKLAKEIANFAESAMQHLDGAALEERGCRSDAYH